MIKENTVKIKLKDIMENTFEMNFDAFGNDFVNMDLLGTQVGFKASDLVSLYFNVIKEFNINIPEKDIIEGKFNTFNNIAGIICRQCQDLL